MELTDGSHSRCKRGCRFLQQGIGRRISHSDLLCWQRGLISLAILCDFTLSIQLPVGLEFGRTGRYLKGCSWKEQIFWSSTHHLKCILPFRHALKMSLTSKAFWMAAYFCGCCCKLNWNCRNAASSPWCCCINFSPLEDQTQQCSLSVCLSLCKYLKPSLSGLKV